MIRTNFLSLVLILLFVGSLRGESRLCVGFAYWDVGRMYDTLPSKFYDDSDYTPKGRNRWDSWRYSRKVERVASVLDSMRLPIIALFGVESEGVVRDVVRSTKVDYSYLHRTIDGRDGLDFALLYFGDLLFIDYVHTDYGRIYIEATIASTRVGIWLTRYGYYQKNMLPPNGHRVDMMLLAGGLYDSDVKRLQLTDLMLPHERQGHGNAMSYRGWYMRHRIALPDSVEVRHSGVYITPWLLKEDRTAPKPTISKGRYWGGYSPYLPLFVYFYL